MLKHQALRIKAQVASAKHGVFFAVQAKDKLPGQKCLFALLHAIDDHEAWVLGGGEHVAEDVFDGGDAVHVVKRVFEMGVRAIDFPDIAECCRRQRAIPRA